MGKSGAYSEGNMLEGTQVHFYFFSGTGNTFLVAQRMANVFAEEGMLQVSMWRIERTEPSKVSLTGTVGLAVPVAAQSTYKFIWNFIERMPQANGTPVFMVDTLAGFSGGIVGPLRQILQRKGYTPIGAKEIVMPSNFCVLRIDEDKKMRAIERGLKKAEDYARALLSGTARWPAGFMLGQKLLFAFSRMNSTWQYMAKRGVRFQVDEIVCTQCSLCAKLCPVSNIVMKEIPVFSDMCQQCMRCFALCPVGAISVANRNYARYSAVTAQELLAEPGSGYRA